MAPNLKLWLLISLCVASVSAMSYPRYQVNRFDSVVVDSPSSSFGSNPVHDPNCRHRIVQHQPVRTSYTQSAPAVDRSQFLPYSNYYNYQPGNRVTTYETYTYNQPSTYDTYTYQRPASYDTYTFRQPSQNTRNECARCIETNRRTHYPTEVRYQAPVENVIPYVPPPPAPEQRIPAPLDLSYLPPVEEKRAPEPPVLSYLPPVDVKESPILSAVQPKEEPTTTEPPAFTFRANPPKDNYGRMMEARAVTEAAKTEDETSEMAQALVMKFQVE